MEKIINWKVAEGMLNMAAYIVTRELYESTGTIPDDALVTELARNWFMSYCEVEEIALVEVEEEES